MVFAGEPRPRPGARRAYGAFRPLAGDEVRTFRREARSRRGGEAIGSWLSTPVEPSLCVKPHAFGLRLVYGDGFSATRRGKSRACIICVRSGVQAVEVTAITYSCWGTSLLSRPIPRILRVCSGVATGRPRVSARSATRRTKSALLGAPKRS